MTTTDEARPGDGPTGDPDDEAVAAAYPGAREPDRTRVVSCSGVGIAVHEWGDVDAPAVLLTHGGFDFARTFDVFAPLLADAGWRAVAWDQRGHGDSQHAALYSMEADVRDGAAVLATLPDGPVAMIGHSKGGGIVLQLADALPHRVGPIVNLDGMPGRRRAPDVHDHERSRLLADELSGWLDHRRRAGALVRRPGTLDELARRRGRMNPRLSIEWLRHLVTVGARHDDDGWRWKIDPALRLGGFGPVRPEWNLGRLTGLGVPLIAVLGTVRESMGAGLRVDDVAPHLPPGAEVLALEDTGHFVHIERPVEVAALALDFLAATC